MIFHSDQVALIDFAGGQPGANELAQLPGSGHFMVMRDGTARPGRFVNMIGGDTVIWENKDGQRQQFAIRDVGRVYLNPQSARTVFNYNGPTAAVGTAGPGVQGRTITVDAKRAWTDTGIVVKQGDRVVFQASGQIQYGRGPGQTASPDGGSERRAAYPDPTVPVGALLGKIGNSSPFGIGTQSQPLTMPASGRLMLGVNDNELGDNSGSFTVIVTKQP
jgi:PA-IL-like protein